MRRGVGRGLPGRASSVLWVDVSVGTLAVGEEELARVDKA